MGNLNPFQNQNHPNQQNSYGNANGYFPQNQNPNANSYGNGQGQGGYPGQGQAQGYHNQQGQSQGHGRKVNNKHHFGNNKFGHPKLKNQNGQGGRHHGQVGTDLSVLGELSFLTEN